MWTLPLVWKEILMISSCSDLLIVEMIEDGNSFQNYSLISGYCLLTKALVVIFIKPNYFLIEHKH